MKSMLEMHGYRSIEKMNKQEELQLRKQIADEISKLKSFDSATPATLAATLWINKCIRIVLGEESA